MSIKDKTSKLVNLKQSVTKIEIQAHPDEILELDEETVAIGRAKLAGIDFTEIFGDEDRSSPELMVRTQAAKIRDLFKTPEELRRAFTSPQKIEEANKDMLIDGIDLEFVRGYCAKRQIEFQNDAQALIVVGFEPEQSGEVDV